MSKWKKPPKEHRDRRRRRIYEKIQEYSDNGGIGLSALQKEAGWDGKKLGSNAIRTHLLQGVTHGWLTVYSHGRSGKFIPGPKWGWVTENILGGSTETPKKKKAIKYCNGWPNHQGLHNFILTEKEDHLCGKEDGDV